jgi:hypothetical protein
LPVWSDLGMAFAQSGDTEEMTMSNFVETWKGIATALGRSERWCRYMARRGADPLPVFKVGAIEAAPEENALRLIA